MMIESDSWTERLSEYLNGELRAPEQEALEAHLEECAACSRVLDDLRGVVAAAHELPETGPSRDLWPDIAASIGARRGAAAREEDGVIKLPTAERPESRPRARGVWLTTPQLAAASVVLVMGSALVTWSAGRELGTRGTALSSASSAATMASLELDDAPAGLADELRGLESLLARSSSELDPNTVRLIQRNLDVIERAIAESREALEVEPDNAFLVDHLERAYRRKVAYLREATQLAGISD